MLTPGDQVWVRATVRETFPNETLVRLDFESPRMTNSVCVNEADVCLERNPPGTAISAA